MVDNRRNVSLSGCLDTLFESRDSTVPIRRICINLYDYTIRHHLLALFQWEQRRKLKMHICTQHRFPTFFFKLHLTSIIVNKYNVSTDINKKNKGLGMGLQCHSFPITRCPHEWLWSRYLKSLWWFFVLTTNIHVNMICEVPNEICVLNVSKCSFNSSNPMDDKVFSWYFVTYSDNHHIRTTSAHQYKSVFM